MINHLKETIWNR